MPRPDTQDPASLDRFVDSLLAAGFEPVGDGRSWRGPIHPALTGLTTATEMRVRIVDGWPWVSPRVEVRGLPLGRHRNAAGDVCLWAVGDPSLEWLTWAGIEARIGLWAAEAQGRGTADDPSLEPHLTFTGLTAGLATINLTGRALREGDVSPLAATRNHWGLEIGEGGEVGRWYVRERPTSPPQTIDDLRLRLLNRQRDDLDEILAAVGSDGGPTFIVFAWSTPVGPNLLVLGLVRRADGTVEARPYEAARTDVEILQARAGPDAERLKARRVAVFGVGAVGSRVADLLARQGVGSLDLFDSQRLRPGDVVRHNLSRIFLGDPKTTGMRTSIFAAAEWSRVDTHGATWAPTTIGQACAGADLVLDATGMAVFAEQLSRICARDSKPLVSAALYRSGRIGRVRLQVADGRFPISDRHADERVPIIPPGDDEGAISWEAGCADPIVESSPIRAASLAATAARVVSDHLCGRLAGECDVIEVYEPLDGPAPFDVIGTRWYRVTCSAS